MVLKWINIIRFLSNFISLKLEYKLLLKCFINKAKIRKN